MIKEKELTQLASLARINLTEAERAKLLNDLRAILDYVAQLKQVAPIGKGSWITVAGPANVLRGDNPSVGVGSGGETDTLLAAAPRTQGAYFKVKAIFGDKNKNGG